MTGKREQAHGPGRPRDPGVDAAVLAAGLELLLAGGVEHASIERIAKHAKVAKVTVYRRWSSKEDLLADAIEAAREEIPAADDPDVPADALPDVIEELLPRWAEMLTQPRYRVLSAQLMGAGSSHPKLLEAWREHHYRPRRVRALNLLRRAQESGVLPGDTDLEILVDMLNGAIMQFLVFGPKEPGPEQVRDYLRRLLAQAGLVRG